MNSKVYSTSTNGATFDPMGYAVVPSDSEPFDNGHYGCVHSIGYCANADWD